MPRGPEERRARIGTAGTVTGRDRGGQTTRAARVRIGGRVVNDPKPAPTPTGQPTPAARVRPSSPASRSPTVGRTSSPTTSFGADTTGLGSGPPTRHGPSLTDIAQGVLSSVRAPDGSTILGGSERRIRQHIRRPGLYPARRDVNGVMRLIPRHGSRASK